MSDYTLKSFQPHIGSIFQLMVDSQPVLNLKLSEVEDLTVEDRLRDPAIRSQPYSLIFHGPMNPVAKQAIYSLSHVELGDLSLFLVPIGPDCKTPDVLQYQAIFN